MNAVSNPTDMNLTEESDTESIPDESPPEYYEPLSNAADDEDSSSSSDTTDHESNFQPPLVNGHIENGISCLDLEEEEDEEEEEERIRREAMQQQQRAFEEEERRRRAPLTQENAVRVMEAMRGISFQGLAPDWAAAEDRWMDQLAAIRVRQSPSSST